MEFIKQALRPAKYLSGTKGADGKRIVTDVPLDRMKGWVNQFRAMKKAGLSIPVPWDHKPDALPVKDRESYSTKDNAGWLEDLWIQPNGDLYCKVDIPREEDISRIGTTVKEVSVSYADHVDGDGREWKDCIRHLALTLHPAFNGQENFQPVTPATSETVTDPSKQTPAIALSTLSVAYEVNLSDEDSQQYGKDGGNKQPNTPNDGAGELPAGNNASSANIKDALRCLLGVGVKLPDDTTPANLIERIVVVCGGLQHAQGQVAGEGDEDQGQPKEQPSPVAMSTEGATDGNPNPNPSGPPSSTTNLSTGGDMSNPYAEALGKQVAEQYKARFQKLINTGRLAKSHYEAKILPLLASEDAICLSTEVVEGKEKVIVKAAPGIDTLLETLEAIPEGGAFGVTGGGKGKPGLKKTDKGYSLSVVEEDPPEYQDDDITMSDEDIRAFVGRNNFGLVEPQKVAV